MILGNFGEVGELMFAIDLITFDKEEYAIVNFNIVFSINNSLQINIY